MTKQWINGRQKRDHFDRRTLLRTWLLGATALECAGNGTPWTLADQQPKPVVPPGDEVDPELTRARSRLKDVTNRPIRVVRSAHFQAIGDASESFMKLTLGDCELIALDYMDHYRAKGFDVKLPDRPLTVVTLFDERPFQKLNPGVPPGTIGLYSIRDNLLFVYDFRNVPMASRAGHANIDVLSHESNHLLSFNTGLLNPQGDVPRAIVEGIGMYAEGRPLHGRGQLGRLNLFRLDSVAHLQRGRKWVDVQDLLVDDRAAFGSNFALSYAESWLLVYHLMTSATRLPQFRAYLKAIRGRLDKNRRFDDAETHFGNLDRLDDELRRVSIQLQKSR